jgi:hypothetical protein
MAYEFGMIDRYSLTRRDLLTNVIKTAFIASAIHGFPATASQKKLPIRAINIMNFIRAEEPREPMDLFEPVREQMRLIKAHGFPATWLLQYDALVEGPFVEFLKSEMPANHEVGIWFEMNRKIVDDAGLTWRGNLDWEWDYHVPVAYAIGYLPDERRKLADTAVATFKRIFGTDVKSVASWNLDAISISHFSDKYGIDAFANCRDQLATDGFTIWGAPIAGYYPNRVNAWSPAVEPKNQLPTPMFRLLGQDPVYYYDNQIPSPDTMEPVWPTGQSPTFVDNYLDMIDRGPSLAFAYAQLGQENSFGWDAMKAAYPMQMDKLAQVADEGHIVIETMGDTGRRFKRSFKSTPTQAQVMLQDPFGHADPVQRTVWYQSKFLRANLHFVGTKFYLRDLHVYSDGFPQPYLTDPARRHGIEQRMLAVLDGYHWSDDAVRSGRDGVRAMGKFVLIGQDGQQADIEMAGLPTVTESGSTLSSFVPLGQGAVLSAVFREREIEFKLSGTQSGTRLGLTFQWVDELSALSGVTSDTLAYSFRGFNYSVKITNGSAERTATGVTITAAVTAPLRLMLAQIT